MACVICLENSTNTAERFIDIFSEEDSKLSICKIISQHLWFKPNKDLSSNQLICWNCWVALRDFHLYYIRVAELHLTDWKYPFTITETEQDNDPLPQGVELKFEQVVENEDSSQNIESLKDNFFGAEIKLEFQDLDELPQTEIVEESIPAEDITCSEGRHKNGNIECTLPAIITKIDYTSSKDNDLKNELPLSVKFNVAENDAEFIKGSTETLTISQNFPSDEGIAEPQRKEAEKPQKFENNEYLPSFIIIKEEIDFENSHNLDNSRLEITEKIPLDSTNDGTHNNVDLWTDDNDYQGTEDSEGSSLESDDSYKPKLEYAIIPKKKVLKPKKYRKRPKPSKPPNRRSREEIEARNAQQEQYEKIIMNFFGRIACSVCELLVHNFTEIREHFRASHNIDPGYMLCCERKFFQRKPLVEHIYLHWNPEHFKCKICGEVCKSSRRLAEHEEGHADPTKIRDKQSFKCDKCEKTFSKKSGLHEHFYSKHVPKSEYEFACTDCDKKYPTRVSLRDHKKKTHGPKSTIICDKCGKEVRTTYLKKHREREHSEVPRPTPQPQQCQICGVWLRHMSGLKQHMKTVHEDSGGEHLCKICNKVSTNARALKRHIYMNHDSERKFKCSICEKSFKRPQDLREHTSVHTGKALYNCPNCSMSFFSSTNMYTHRQRRHPIEYEADKRKPKFLLNIMAQSMGRMDSISNEELPSDDTSSKPL